MKFLRALCVFAIALCLAGSVYAETQSVKVSGDLTMRGVYRDQYDYRSNGGIKTGDTRTGIQSPTQNWFMTNAEVQVEADLTDNVQTVIRLANQRDWNVYSKSVTSGSGINNSTGNPTASTTLAWNGRGGYTADNNEFDVIVDLAYVTLKDFIYSPLTVTIGRQDLWFGKGFIVGANLQTPSNTIAAPEYTSIWSFDSVKAVLDFDPWTLTGIYAKVYENAIQAEDDVDLYGVNVGYKFDKMNGEAEAYWFYKKNNEVDNFWEGKSPGNNVHNIGIRGSFDPIDIVTIAAEGVFQGGTYVGSRQQRSTRSREAWALDVSGECRYFTDKVMWKPKIGAEYIAYSGQEDQNAAQASGKYRGFDGMYRGKFDSAIREFVGKFYSTARYGTRQDQLLTCPDASFTNQSQVIFMGSVQPLDNVTVKANYNLFWNFAKYEMGNNKSKGFIGQEVDLTAKWDYTEDVNFAILAGWFVPGYVYGNEGDNHLATDVVATVGVSF